jgi:hypothetical protein
MSFSIMVFGFDLVMPDQGFAPAHGLAVKRHVFQAVREQHLHDGSSASFGMDKFPISAFPNIQGADGGTRRTVMISCPH